MNDYYDELEVRSREDRDDAGFATFPAFLDDIKKRIPGWNKRLVRVESAEINSRQAMSKIPVLRKPELMEAQGANPPFGEFVDADLLAGSRIFMSPGPVWEVQAPGADPWLAARAFHAAGFRKGDLVHCSIGFSITPGGAILEEGARALGAAVFPAGVGGTDGQVEAAAFLKPTAYAGTPDYLQTMLDRAKEMGKDLSSITKALVSGGALFPSMREAYSSQGISVLQAYATADIGSIAHETMHNGEVCEGLVCNENLIVEIVRPGSDDPVEDGEVGEIVVTSFNKAYPLVRFGTGDLSATISEPSPCGRTNMRIKGWMGRADQRTKVKGMFVDPKQIDQLVKSVDGLASARLVVSRAHNKDAVALKVVGNNLNVDSINDKFVSIANLKGAVEVVESLPNDGMVIEDQRDYAS